MGTLLVAPRAAPPIATTDGLDALLAADAPVALGISGGKDSVAMAFATTAYLDRIGHTGPRILIHSDLGRVEWQDSGPTCERLAAALGLELIVVRRGAGDMMDRWLTRWQNNVQRYADLSCVKLILPWSTPSMRFCTSELKTDVITRALVKRWPGQTILSASGIRRDESSARAKAPIAKEQAKLSSKTHGTTGLDWHPILDWSLEDVWAEAARRGFRPHEAYGVYGSSRVSCAFCIMGSAADLVASTACPDNQDIYREMVGLEADCTFSFQSSWLGDVAPDLLTEELRERLARAKGAALLRERAESRIPAHLLYTPGWPHAMPTWAEAEMLAEVRRAVAAAVGIEVAYTDAASILARYRALMIQAGKDSDATVAPPIRAQLSMFEEEGA